MNRPYVICHMLQSIDGKIAGGFFREKQTLELAKIYSDISKDYNGDAIIYGTTTAKEMFSKQKLTQTSINTQLPKTDYVYQDDKHQWIVVIDPQGEIIWDETVSQNTRLKDKNLIVILTENVSSQYLETLKSLNISYLFTGKEEIDLRLALEKLYDLFSIKKLLLQGGGITNTYFIKEDLIEEVGRIYGVDNIQGKLPVVPMKMGHLDKTTRKIRAKMSNMGLNETLSYILINDKDVHKFTTDEFEEVRLLDPITEERNTLRYSMIPSLYKIYEYNKARENKDVCLFEIGKGFWKKGEEYGENQKICVLMTGKYYEGIGHNKNVDFYDIKGVTEELLDYLGYAGRYSFVVPKQMPAEFHPGQTAEISVNNDIVGIVGRIHPSVEKEAVYVMEINLDKLLAKRVGKMKFKEISKFPVIKKDLALLVDKNITSKEVEMLIKKKAGKLLLDINVFDVYEGKNIDSNKRSIAYSLTFGATDRTLNDDEINSILEGIITDLENKGFEIRK